MQIRKLTNEELSLAVNLHIDCWNNDYTGIVPADVIDEEKELAFLTSWINCTECDDIRRIYGAFDENRFAGYVGASIAEKEDVDNGVELNYLFVKKEYRGIGLGLKLIKTIIDEYHEYDIDKLIVYNWHESNSNEFYKYLGGEVIKQVTQCVKSQEALIDVFMWDIKDISTKLTKMLYSRDVKQGGFHIH